MKKTTKIIIAAVSIFVLVALFTGETIFSLMLYDKNKKMEDFISTNYDVDIDKWDGTKVVQDIDTEKDIVKQMKKAFSNAIGVDIEGDTFEKFFSNLFGALWCDGEEEIHDIYDDTAVVEAYKSGDSSELSEEDAYILETASGVINEIIKSDMTEYEKELAVYNWQVKYVSYDESNFSAIPDDVDKYNYYPYGVFKYHSAICVGNATTFKLFMDMLGIDCKIIHSTQNGEHAWDLVNIDDDWYHVDVTFDGGDTEPNYSYFNVPDSVKLGDGFPWKTDDFPAATATKYTYSYNNAIEFTKADEVPQLIRDGMDSGKTAIYLKCATEINIESIVEDIYEKVSDNTYLCLNMVKEIGDYYVYYIGCEKYSDSESDDSSISDIITNLF